MSARVLIVWDDFSDKWYVRRVGHSYHDMDRDVMVYQCDEPLANDLNAMEAFTAAIKEVDAAQKETA